ncbi:MAG: hypothetical protein DMF91_15590 [Acidobacteria bacterium]|nr:MAG: hypothetical protein DMF91_15590 [Acidobacteriota bacterium]
MPFLPASLEDLDSINFAMGVRHFDVAHHQPHPPGYPVFIVAAKIARVAIGPDEIALSLVSILAGALAIFALFALFRAIDADPRSERRAAVATLLTVTAPLYWFTAIRPLSDTAGLAAALAVQALTLTAAGPSGIAAAGFLAAFAAGIRSQVVWLTVPLLALTVVRRPAWDRGRTAATAAAAFLAGGLVWGIPLVISSGGPRAYWHAVFDQGAEDLTGIQMLWTTPTLRQLALALYNTFVAPWSLPVIATIVIVLAIGGAVSLLRTARRPLLTLAVAFVPYVVFDLLFQETVTTRYALPLVPPMAYLAVRAPTKFVRWRVASFVLLALINASSVAIAVYGYSRVEAPAFRLLGDMRTSTSRPRTPPLAPVLAMHRREDLDLRRPIAWVGDQMPRVSQRLPAPPKHEWLELVKYWNGGGRDEVWFVADPARTDLALVDHDPFRTGTYRWQLQDQSLVGGVRPDIMDWYRLRHPGWYLGEGWALTPETAGVAQEDGRGPGRAPIQGWIRRRREDVVLMIGGRNLSRDGPPAEVHVALDGRPIDDPTVPPGFFLRMLKLPPGALDGAGEYATISISAGPVRLKPDTTESGARGVRLQADQGQPVNVAIEQFDAQSSDRVVFGFGDGWQELEYNPALGRLWRWTSERAVLHVHAAGRPLTLTLAGEPPLIYFWKPVHVKISAGGRVVAEETLSTRFAMHVRIPAELVAAIETDQTYVPAERIRRSPDRRRLGLRVFQCEVQQAVPRQAQSSRPQRQTPRKSRKQTR